jgi:hypothetical protein
MWEELAKPIGRERLDDLINGGGPHDLVAKMAEKAGQIEKGLKTGEYKCCKKEMLTLKSPPFRAASLFRHVGSWHKTDMPTALRNLRCWGRSGHRSLLA